MSAPSLNIKDYLDSKEESVSQLFQARSFLIPLNQRPFVWTKKELLRLWEDLRSTTERIFDHGTFNYEPSWQGDPHFIGFFVLEHQNQGSNTYEVVDGQQRMVCLTMISAILRESIYAFDSRWPTNSISPKKKNDLINDLENLLTTGSSSKKTPRLKLDQAFDGTFQACVVEPINERDRGAYLSKVPPMDREHPTSQTITSAFDELRTKVLDDVNQVASSSPENYFHYVEAITECLNHGLILVRTSVKQDAFALNVFANLNSTGKALSQADLIKNELFLATKSSLHNQVYSRWKEISENTRPYSLETFFRLQHIAFHGECKTKKVHENIKSLEIKNQRDNKIVTLMDEWVRRSHLFKQINDRSPSVLKPKTQEILRVIQDQLNVSLSLILLLAIADKELSRNEPNFKSSAELCLNFCFRRLTVGSVDTSILEQELGKLARGYRTAVSSVVFLKREMTNFDPDIEFEESFSRWTVKRPGIQFYALEKLETLWGSASGVIPYPRSPNQHIEHIMPKKALKRPSDWKSAAHNPEKFAFYLNRIGNLLILESDINKSVSNYSFKAKKSGRYPPTARKPKGLKKRKSYADSKLQGPKKLAIFSTWNFSNIDKRQEFLAKEALKIWNYK